MVHQIVVYYPVFHIIRVEARLRSYGSKSYEAIGKSHLLGLKPTASLAQDNWNRSPPLITAMLYTHAPLERFISCALTTGLASVGRPVRAWVRVLWNDADLQTVPRECNLCMTGRNQKKVEVIDPLLSPVNLSWPLFLAAERWRCRKGGLGTWGYHGVSTWRSLGVNVAILYTTPIQEIIVLLLFHCWKW